ncbi:MAG: hypothetical protein ACI9HK_004685 [Pirellulaceae bacterium]|jgi:hypothetical protein
MISPSNETVEKRLLEKAITALICALAHDEASRGGAGKDELEELRKFWVPDAEKIVDEAERLGLLGDEHDD